MNINKNHFKVLLTREYLLIMSAVVLIQFFQTVNADETKNFPALELQSRLMSFADQFTAEVEQAINQYLFQGAPKLPRQRMSVANGRLNACASAVSIAAGKNPQIALLDMIALIKLHIFTVEDNWMPKLLGPEAKIFIDTFNNLEKQLWQIADGYLSKQQINKLNALLVEWRRENKDRLAVVSNVRFSEFGDNRYSGVLFEKGKAGGLLKKVGEATREIERTRLLAERAIFLAERQPKLIAWRVEQVFYNLSVTEEAGNLVESLAQLPESTGGLTTSVEKLAFDIDNIRQVLSVDNWVAFVLYGMLMLLVLLAIMLCYKYISLKMEYKFNQKYK